MWGRLPTGGGSPEEKPPSKYRRRLTEVYNRGPLAGSDTHEVTPKELLYRRVALSCTPGKGL